MYHSVTIGEKNTWTDWHLIPSSPPIVNPPSVFEKNTDIPGVNGQYDQTEFLLGRPLFGSRTGSWEFMVMNDYWEWYTAYKTILKYLHGKRFRCVLEDDSGYYYDGRFKVNEWKSEKDWSRITIDYTMDPYKKSILSTANGGDWLWDPFNFLTGYISNLGNVTISGTKEIVIYGGTDYDSPNVTLLSGDSTMTYKALDGTNKTITLTVNEPVSPEDILIVAGENTVTFTGNGAIRIDYREGLL